MPDSNPPVMKKAGFESIIQGDVEFFLIGPALCPISLGEIHESTQLLESKIFEIIGEANQPGIFSGSLEVIKHDIQGGWGSPEGTLNVPPIRRRRKGYSDDAVAIAACEFSGYLVDIKISAGQKMVAQAALVGKLELRGER